MNELEVKQNSTDEMIEILKSEGMEITDEKIKNTIQLIIHETFMKGKEQGIEHGMKIGINQTCKDIEMKLSTIRSKAR